MTTRYGEPRGLKMGLKIRDFEASDIPACAQASAEVPLFQKYGLTLDRAQELLEEKIKLDSSHLFTAEFGSSFAGMIDLVENGMFALTPYVRQIVVDDSFQGKGVGRQLMGFVETKYKKKYGLSLLVNEDNLAAIQFYKKLGYSQIGKIDGYIQPELNELIFFKK